MAGFGHTCALMNDGTVKCWGLNSRGQVGDGTGGSRSTADVQELPVDVIGLSEEVTGLSAGADHTCALMASSKVFCWGDNHQGQLSDGVTAPDTLATAPVPVLSISKSLGDYDCDGSVTSLDAALILQFAARISFSSDCWENGDVNRDGPIDSLDALLVLQYVAGLLEDLTSWEAPLSIQGSGGSRSDSSFCHSFSAAGRRRSPMGPS